MTEYDLIVIGAGSGLDVASAAAQQDMDVAVVEDGPMGGTCLNRGCIPSKMLIHRADVARTIQNAEQFHIDAEINGHDFAAMIEEVNDEVDEDASSIEKGIRNTENMTLYKTEGRFVDERTLEVGDKEITGEKIVLAAGTRPMVPPIDGLDETDYLTSREALRLEEQPDHLVILGGGYIAAELAHFYGSLGTDITVIEMTDTMIGHEDIDIKERFTDLFSDEYEVYLEHKATAVAQEGDTFTVEAESKDGELIEVSGDELLVATGRVPNTDRLKVEEAGIETDDRGFVENNEYLETSADGVWALGDIAGNWLFKHSANYEAQIVFENAVIGHQHDVDYTAMPHAIFSEPQVAGVGYTEQELEEDDEGYVVGTYEYARTGMGAALKENDGFVKVLADPETREILGCHILGPDASTLIHEVLVAMRTGSGTVEDITATIHIHPALSEVVQRAFNEIR